MTVGWRALHASESAHRAQRLMAPIEPAIRAERISLPVAERRRS